MAIEGTPLEPGSTISLRKPMLSKPCSLGIPSTLICKSLDLTFRSSSDGHETPLRDEDTLIRRRHAKPALSVGDRGQAPKPPSGPPQAAGLRSVSNGRTIRPVVKVTFPGPMAE